MSTLSGVSAKGEKGKPKFQSLDINNLYRASRGESLETHQLKNTSSRRHGMQTLGKIPSARRAPANLPSLKSEYSGCDPAISLVPTGGTGWGSKPGETGPPPPSTTQVSISTTSITSASNTPPATAAITVSTPTVTVSSIPATITPSPAVHSDKSWSSITSSTTEVSPMFLAHQSPYFQQEFPSLSGDANTATGSGLNKTDAIHLPGPSLRPQTEGSWIQGGSRPQGQMAAGVGNQQGTAPVPAPLHHHPQGLDVNGGRSNLVPSGVGVGLAGHIPPHHYRLMPQFMIRHSHQSGGGFPTNYHGPPRLRFPFPPDARLTVPNRGSPNVEQDEITSRPIIKEEDLKVMDEISRDTGWAAHDEIDYNQTLSFSDEEGTQDDKLKARSLRQMSQGIDKRDADKTFGRHIDSLNGDEKLSQEESFQEAIDSSQSQNKETQRSWHHQTRQTDLRQNVPSTMASLHNQPARALNQQSGRQGEEDDVWRERRRLQNEEIAIAVERAKQRKEEEEKRYEETRQAAARKLQMLEEKMRTKTASDKEEISASISVTIQHVPNVLLPDWEKDKEKNLTVKDGEDKNDKPIKEPLSLENSNSTQMENKIGFNRDKERDRDRDMRSERESNAQPFSRQFQSNLPPRFQKQASERTSPYYRQGSGGSPQPSPGGHLPYDNRWATNSHFGGSIAATKSQKSRTNSDVSEYDRDESKDNRGYGQSAVDSDLDSCVKDRYEKISDSDDYSSERNEDRRQYDDVRESDSKSSYENFKPVLSCQEVGLNNMEKETCNTQIEQDKKDVPPKVELKDRSERPQRPDSRDSRASRDSRTSKDSNREDKIFEEGNIITSLSWADSNYELEHRDSKYRVEIKEERDLRRDSHGSYHQRHIPGPITREKLEASELKCDIGSGLNLVPLVRSDKKLDLMKTEKQWEQGSSNDSAWNMQTVAPVQGGTPAPDCWGDMTVHTLSKNQCSEKIQNINQGHDSEASQHKTNPEDSNKAVSNISPQPREEAINNRKSEPPREKLSGRGGNRGMRHETRGSRQSWGPSYYRGGPAWRGADARGRRIPHRRANMGREYGHSESEASADEVSASTESGKEDKRQEQDRKHFPRFQRQGFKKPDKDERFRENKTTDNNKDVYPYENDSRKHDKKPPFDDRMSGFEPRGEPSRRGRGAPFRSKGSAANVGRRMDGYGPPTSKRPFTSESSTVIHEERKSEGSLHNQAYSKENISSKLSHDEKIKLNQQQLAAGITGNARLGFKSQSPNVPPRMRRKSEGERKDRKVRDGTRREQRSMKSGSASGGEVDENWETTSETSEHEDKEIVQEDSRHQDNLKKPASHNIGSSKGQPRRLSQNNRYIGREKRRGTSYDPDWENNSRRLVNNSTSQSVINGNTRTSNGKVLGHVKDQGEKSLRPENKEKRNNLDRIDLCNTASVVVIDDQPERTVEEDQTVFATDNNGFQEVRSKKNVKEANRQQKEEPKSSKERMKAGKSQSPGPSSSSQLSPSSANKGSYERTRPGKLPPRFAKLRETSRLQKMAQQTQDVNELNKISIGTVSGFTSKDLTCPAPPPPVNAWDKPITAALRTSTPPVNSSVSLSAFEDPCKVESREQVSSPTGSQRSSPDEDKSLSKQPREPMEKTVLDGTSPPVQTIIFENTNYKSVPTDAGKSNYTSHLKNQRPERKIEEESLSLGFKSPGPDMNLPETKADPIQMPISFVKNEDNADMKLDFRFDSDLSPLTEDKTNKSITTIQMTRSIQMATQSSAAELQFKLASVKKVWENPPSTLEHTKDETNPVSSTASFTPTFGNSVEDTAAYGKTGVDSGIDDSSTLTSEGVYNPGQPIQSNSNSYGGNAVQNMIKPDPSSNVCKVKPQPQTAMLPHTGPLSPPGTFASSSAQPGQHISYQPPAQYGISAIPSPPTVFAPQGELYPTFQINNPVIGNHSQGRSQFSQFASPYFSQNLGQTSGFSQQSLYHVQPVTAAPPPDMFSQLRMQQQAYGTSQQLSNNPNTVLISSSTNSLMSASVKPSPPPIGAIGSKAGSYQAPSQPPPSQLYIYPDPQTLLNQSPYLQNSQLVQRQANNVVPTITPSSGSYYSASTGGATSFYQHGSSSMQAAAPTMHQTAFGLQAFNTQSPAATPAGMGSFGSTLPRLILQNPVAAAVGVVGSRMAQTPHRSNSPVPPRANTSSPRFKPMPHRQPN